MRNTHAGLLCLKVVVQDQVVDERTTFAPALAATCLAVLRRQTRVWHMFEIHRCNLIGWAGSTAKV